MLNKENLDKATALFARYPEKKAALLPILWIAQEQEGWISTDMMKYVGDLVGVPYAHVMGVVTFYTMFNDKKLGRHHIEVCTNVSCLLRGSDKIVAAAEKVCGTKLGSTSADGKFTLSEVECMGACGGAPMLAIGEEYHEHLTAEKAEQILTSLK
ncbi:MAG: NAD(P)H-dependent oxidoreductase subunit E [Bacteroidetes bacterium]|nr:NAD(P)H-dependent oxidoreductase subunit E [Bacteroidota bacterium]